jgi:hypothetical protein
MKTLAFSALALAAIAFLGACDSHSVESTKALHVKPAIHSGAEHGAGHGAAAEHGEAGKDEHAADEHAAKSAESAEAHK